MTHRLISKRKASVIKNAKNLTNIIFQADDKNLMKIKQKILEDNYAFSSGAYNACMIRGVVSQYLTLTRFEVIKAGTSPEVIPQIEEYTLLANKRDRDYQIVFGTLELVLDPCQTLQDMRDALPECVYALSPDTFADAPTRTRPEEYSLQDAPLKLKQYLSKKDIIIEYAMAKFIL